MSRTNPNPQPSRLPAVLRQNLNHYFFKFKQVSAWPSVRIGFLCLTAYVLLQKDFSFSISFGKQQETAQKERLLEASPYAIPARYEEEKPATKPNSEPKETYTPPVAKKPAKTAVAKTVNQAPRHWWETARNHSQKMTKADFTKTEKPDVRDLNLANPATAVSSALSPEQQKKAASYSNLGFLLNPDLAERRDIDPSIVQAKNQICFDYVSKYTPIALEEARLYNVPASITLAQGLLESNAGESNLARKEHNHFGIKCKSQCVGCRCANYTDDSRFDMFRIFESDAQSFREHSLLLTGSRYKHLLDLPRTDYQNWAYGLKAAGYATDPKYASKLIAIIEALQLDKLDR